MSNPISTIHLGDATPSRNRFESIALLASAIAERLLPHLIQFAVSERPHAQKATSSWVWLDEDLQLHVTRANQRQIGKGNSVRPSSSLLVEHFPAVRHVTAHSNYHRLVKCADGDVFLHRTENKITLMAGMKRGKLANWERYQLTPSTPQQLEEFILGAAFRDHLADQVTKWLSQGTCNACTEMLTLQGLQSAARHYPRFVVSVGADRFNAAITREVHLSLRAARQITPSTPVGDSQG